MFKLQGFSGSDDFKFIIYVVVIVNLMYVLCSVLLYILLEVRKGIWPLKFFIQHLAIYKGSQGSLWGDWHAIWTNTECFNVIKVMWLKHSGLGSANAGRDHALFKVCFWHFSCSSDVFFSLQLDHFQLIAWIQYARDKFYRKYKEGNEFRLEMDRVSFPFFFDMLL